MFNIQYMRSMFLAQRDFTGCGFPAWYSISEMETNTEEIICISKLACFHHWIKKMQWQLFISQFFSLKQHKISYKVRIVRNKLTFMRKKVWILREKVRFVRYLNYCYNLKFILCNSEKKRLNCDVNMKDENCNCKKKRQNCEEKVAINSHFILYSVANIYVQRQISYWLVFEINCHSITLLYTIYKAIVSLANIQ